jgi:hypothetical protein
VSPRGSLVGEKSDRLGDLARIGQRLANAVGHIRSGDRLDAGVHDQQRDVNPLTPQLERSGLSDGADAERPRSPQSAAGDRPPR